MESTGMTLNEIAAALRQHAIKNYQSDGWDYLVETFDDEELLKEIEGATTLAEAIAKIAPYLKRLDSRRKDIEATRF